MHTHTNIQHISIMNTGTPALGSACLDSPKCRATALSKAETLTLTNFYLHRPHVSLGVRYYSWLTMHDMSIATPCTRAASELKQHTSNMVCKNWECAGLEHTRWERRGEVKDLSSIVLVWPHQSVSALTYVCDKCCVFKPKPNGWTNESRCLDCSAIVVAVPIWKLH